MQAIGLSHLTALELPPVAFVRAAGAAGFAAVGLRLSPAHPGGVAYSARPGTAEHRALRDAMDSEGVAVRDIEFVPLDADLDLAGLEPLLEAGASLGASSLTVSGDDPDAGRLADTFATLCDMAQPLGLRIDLEFMRWRVVGSYGQAADVLVRAGRANAGILLDVLHLDRSGGDVDTPDLAADGPVRAVQICDAPATWPAGDEAIIREAREGRLVPGEGDLPLEALIARLPPGVAISVETPDASRSTEERLARAWHATQALLSAGGVV